jgi:hypothetical protein
LRPPGYPGFVAASLWIGDAISVPWDAPPKRTAERDRRTVGYAQGILLGATAAALFFWASLWSGFVAAAGIALTAALNPYSLALANLASYQLLFFTDNFFHAGTVCIATFLISRAGRGCHRDSLGPDLSGKTRRARYSVFRCTAYASAVADAPGRQVARTDHRRDDSDGRPVCWTQLLDHRTTHCNRPIWLRVLGDIHREGGSKRTLFGLATDLVETWDAYFLQGYWLGGV